MREASVASETRGLAARIGRMRLFQSLLAAALALFVLAGPSAATDAPKIGQVSQDSVWVPTPERVIRRMLQMADTTSRDVVLDLGAGDGRIPIYAAKHFGARAVGVELEGNLVRLARREAAAQGVSQLAKFEQGDLFKADLSRATVLALYISPGVMSRLKPPRHARGLPLFHPGRLAARRDHPGGGPDRPPLGRARFRARRLVGRSSRRSLRPARRAALPGARHFGRAPGQAARGDRRAPSRHR